MERLYEMAGRCFCVSFARPEDVTRCHEIGQSVMLDNGAFSAWRLGNPVADWNGYYRFADKWLDYPTTWAVIPDVIDGTEEEQDRLVTDWPFRERGAPVWHMNENLERFWRLCLDWPRVCIGSTSVYSEPLSEPWKRRMDAAFDRVSLLKFPPWLHMLRGMDCAGKRWPFASLDSTDIARNHNRPQNTPEGMAKRWDSIQCRGFRSWEREQFTQEIFAP